MTHEDFNPLGPVARALDAWHAPRGGVIGLAVSGGGDSIALMHAAARWADTAGADLSVVSVDHGLRPEASQELDLVARAAAALGLPHSIERWDGWDGKGNLQDAARRARYGLIEAWAQARGIAAVALGHTADDQAETVLLRLARGSGVYGLSAMRPERQDGPITWLRPMLDLGRADLRGWLSAQGIDWADDPSNDDPGFARVRMRRLMPALAAEGIDVARLCEVARLQSRAAGVLGDAVGDLAARAMVALPVGYLTLSRARLAEAPDETALRLLGEALRWVSGADYPPRAQAVYDVLEWITDSAEAAAPVAPDPARRTLGGCVLTACARSLRIWREPAAVGGPVAAGALWDRRWSTPAMTGHTVAALGPEGLSQLSDWRRSGLPREVLLGLPGLWREDALIAAPFAKPVKDCHLALNIGPEQFAVSLGRR